MVSHGNQPQAPDLRQMIADLRRVEELTNVSKERLMAMNDDQRKSIDAEAGILHRRVALQLPSIRQINEGVRRSLDATCTNGELIEIAQTICTAMQVPFEDFVRYSTGQQIVPLGAEEEKKKSGRRHAQCTLPSASDQDSLGTGTAAVNT